jgi:hypothetical protein
MTRTYIIKDHTGVRYGKLVAIRFTRKGRARNRMWLFQCDCGREREIFISKVIAGLVASCGCDTPTLIGRTHALKRNRGIGAQEAAKWLAKTHGRCDICGQSENVIRRGKPKPLSIDHCHSSGRIRGVLCSRCNIMLGYYEKHSAFPSRIECFDHYLGRYPWCGK